MILNDLLDLPVRSSSGELLGVVVDARFTLDGTPHQLLNSPRLQGLIVSPRTHSSFMGYERSGVNSPALIARWFSRRARGTFLVLWRDLASIGGDAVHLRDRAVLYSPRLR
ncbi:MAG: hypothetical protein QOF36_396 [Microbacteriaceae bacterium]|nr:hypothetical protein [Microbacteriaceae bacterium]